MATNPGFYTNPQPGLQPGGPSHDPTHPGADDGGQTARHKVPLMYRVKKIFSGLVLLMVGGYGVFQIGQTAYNYRQIKGHYPGGYLFYLMGDTFGDMGRFGGKMLDFAAAAFATMSGKPTLRDMDKTITVCVPDSLAHEGYFDPAPHTKIAAYRDAVENELISIARQRGTPGSPYNRSAYADRHMTVMVSDRFNSFALGAPRKELLTRIEMSQSAPACPAAHSMQHVTTGETPKLVK